MSAGKIDMTVEEYQEIEQRRSKEDLNRLLEVVGKALGVKAGEGA